MKQTILHQKHLRLKAKMMDFQGWQIPLQFSDVQSEYHAVRSAAGLFDIGYLGRIEVSGAGAMALLQKIVTHNIAKIAEGAAHYGLICNDAGGILDDVLIFRLSDAPQGRRYLLSTNAGNTEKVLLWLKQYAPADAQITEKTSAFAHLALQGPQSSLLLEELAGQHVKKIKLRTTREVTIAETAILVSRTGYTGEQGYEFLVPADRAEALWDAIMTAGEKSGVLACGFSCRDTLRLEMGFRLYGSDIDETRTPLEAGLTPFVDFKKDFIGKEALLKRRAEGIKEKLAGFVLLDKGVPKSGGSIFSENRDIGVVTSGGLSPSLHKGIGLGYVISRYAQAGQEIEIEVRDREIAAKIVDLPFYRKK